MEVRISPLLAPYSSGTMVLVLLSYEADNSQGLCELINTK